MLCRMKVAGFCVLLCALLSLCEGAESVGGQLFDFSQRSAKHADAHSSPEQHFSFRSPEINREVRSELVYGDAHGTEDGKLQDPTTTKTIPTPNIFADFKEASNIDSTNALQPTVATRFTGTTADVIELTTLATTSTPPVSVPLTTASTPPVSVPLTTASTPPVSVSLTTASTTVAEEAAAADDDGMPVGAIVGATAGGVALALAVGGWRMWKNKSNGFRSEEVNMDEDLEGGDVDEGLQDHVDSWADSRSLSLR